MHAKLLISVFLCLGLDWAQGQALPSCSVKIYNRNLAKAMEDLPLGSLSEPGLDGMDGLFSALRSGQETELVILLDNSLEVRPNHFFLVDKPIVNKLFKYHILSRSVSVSLVVFGEKNQTVLCQEVQDDCPALRECISKASYASEHDIGWIGSAMKKAMDQAFTILSQPTKDKKQKIILIISSFQMTNFYVQQMVAMKQNASAIGADIYTVLSSFRTRVAEATLVASTPDKAMDDAAFITKLYSIVPLGRDSCAGVTTAGSNANGIICKNVQPRQTACMCKPGYSGEQCEIRPDYCDFDTACPTGSTCSLRRDYQYTCFCPTCDAPEECMNFKRLQVPTPATQPPPAPVPTRPNQPPPPNNRPRPPPFQDRTTPQPSRDRVTPPRDRPHDLPPGQKTPEETTLAPLPPLDVLLGYITALVERAKACIYPPSDPNVV